MSETETSLRDNKRSKLFKFGEDARWLLAVCRTAALAELTAMMPAHDEFLCFLIEKLKAGAINPKTSASRVLHAATFVNSIDKTFAKKMVFSRSGRINAKAMTLFMKHFDMVLEASQLGWTYSDFLQAVNGQRPQTKSAAPISLPRWAT